jgi:hypothetical protein
MLPHGLREGEKNCTWYRVTVTANSMQPKSWAVHLSLANMSLILWRITLASRMQQTTPCPLQGHECVQRVIFRKVPLGHSDGNGTEGGAGSGDVG